MGYGGNSSRALNAVTTAITAALGGQTDLQVVTNTLAPYAAQVIGQEFGHGENKNTAAQLVSHAILGATLAYINGGDPTAGGSAAVASEAAANYLTNQLAEKYKDDPKYFVNGEFQANLLSETEKAQIRDLTAGIGAVIGGAVGDSTYNAQLAGVIGQNAVENNGFSIIDENYGKVVKENTKVKFSCPTGYVCPIPEKTLGEKTLLVINDLTIRQLAAAMGAEYDPITKEHLTPKEIQDAKVAMLGLGFSKTLSGPIKLTDNTLAAIEKKYGSDIAAKITNNFYRDDDLLSPYLNRADFRWQPSQIGNIHVLESIMKRGGVELKQGVSVEQVFKGVIQKPINERPDPSTYLSQSYINKHLSEFDSGVTRIMVDTSFNKYGIGQIDGTSFVMTKREADAIIRAANNDPVKIANALGIPQGQLKTGGLVRIDISNPKSAGLRLPSGNEAGANSQWIPGGKLPNGSLEAVIDAPKVTKNMLKVKKIGN